MKIELTLLVEDSGDVDSGHDMGITNEAYDRLSDALADAGFAIERGPDRVDD